MQRVDRSQPKYIQRDANLQREDTLWTLQSNCSMGHQKSQSNSSKTSSSQEFIVRQSLNAVLTPHDQLANICFGGRWVHKSRRAILLTVRFIKYCCALEKKQGFPRVRWSYEETTNHHVCSSVFIQCHVSIWGEGLRVSSRERDASTKRKAQLEFSDWRNDPLLDWSLLQGKDTTPG